MIDVEYLRHTGTDLDIVNAARVSFAAESDWEIETDQLAPNVFECTQHLSQRDQKLINFLARHRHHSPFNHAFLSFRVKAPIFVARQLVKHEYLPWNEVSRRYVEGGLEFYWPEIRFYRKQAEDVKQGSGGQLLSGVARSIERQFKAAAEACEAAYQEAISRGLCREQARMILPQSLMTTWVWSGSLHAFAKMCQLRLGSGAQVEAGDVAQPILDTLHNLFPVSTKALMNHGEF